MKIPFSISARTAKLIGMENFANAEGAIVELVKNTYDADADKCIVVADIKEKKADSRIFIIDNGSGMSEDTIINNWMTIGTDDKLVNALSKKNNRVKSGAKGIGRFALNRLGKKAVMATFNEGVLFDAGHLWNVDWTQFEKARVLSDVEADITDLSVEGLRILLSGYSLDVLPQYNELFNDNYHGTVLCISDLNDDWTDDNLNSLLKNLEVLIPSHLDASFSLYLYNLKNVEWGGRVYPIEYEDYDYMVNAEYSGGREVLLRIVRNELNVSLLEAKYSMVFEREEMKKSPYTLDDFKKDRIDKKIIISDSVDDDVLSKVGCFDFTFYFIKNTVKEDSEKDSDKKYPYNNIDSRARKNWLERFGGVRIYRDNFRVRPYGEKGNDWLDLGQRQAKSPGGVGQKMGGYRLRPNQVAGVVNISRVTNSYFEDKSSREGIQENDVFVVFKNILLQIISAFEDDRNYIMYNLSELYKEEHPITAEAKKIVRDTLSKKDSDDSDKDNDLKILAQSYESLESELRDKDAELAMLRGLASIGISMATFAHELKSVMKRLLPRNNDFRKVLMKYLPVEKFDNVDNEFDNPYYQLDISNRDDKKVYNWLQYSLHTIQRSRRDLTNIMVENYFDTFVASWKSTLHNKNIDINIHKKNDLKDAIIECREMDLDSVFNNYIANSVAAFLTSDEENKEIIIEITNDHGYIVVDFIDNGVGLAKEYWSDPDVIFNAFETSVVDGKNNKVGTGMGLYIAKGVMTGYKNSTISLLKVEKGFGIRTIIKLKNNGE